ncbi:MAG: hypothetical protein WC969_04895 [Elusimicrobiota bacterium]|jgi:hypothetical protein
MRHLLLAALPLLALGAAACVDLPQAGGAPAGSISRTSFADLDPGAKTQISLHFEVRAYAVDRAAAVSELAERSYEGIMRDTGLMSFMPRGLYPVVIYGSKEEYLRKTGMPSWSGGAAAGNSIYTFEGPQLPAVLAHEMTHLVFNEYMGRDRTDLRWVNEGLAVYEERTLANLSYPQLDGSHPPLPFDRMSDVAPLSEGAFDAGAWYAQVTSVVRFMIERGGRIGFGQFLASLKDGRTMEDSVRVGFPGIWTSTGALEASWRRTLQ